MKISVRRPESPSPEIGADLVLSVGHNLVTGEADYEKQVGPLTSLERDVLYVASAIFATDLAVKRSDRENVSRDIELTIPVVNSQAFNAQKDTLHLILYTLAHDNWQLNFVRCEGSPEGVENWADSKGKTILFSGGLDSLAGAVDLLTQDGLDSVQLVSHQTGNQTTRKAQHDLVDYLRNAFGPNLNHLEVRTGGKRHEDFPFPADSDREGSQRTRSFMFLSLGALLARRNGMSRIIWLAENGQMAIHLPLTAARIGAFSTHTAHPEFIELARDFFSKLLDYQITIENPYVYRTKAEVVAHLTQVHRDAIPLSTSCWKNARTRMHCGECIPCYVRRVAVEANGVVLDEYDRDVFAEEVGALAPTDDGKRHLTDFLEFIRNFSVRTDTELLELYPDFYSCSFDLGPALDMYKRFAVEARSVMARYPAVNALLAVG